MIQFASKLTVVPLLACALLTPGSSRENQQATQHRKYEDEQGYAVLSTLLDALPKERAGSSPLIRIFYLTETEKRTANATYCRIPEEFHAAAEDFDKPHGEAELADKFKLNVEYEIVSEVKRPPMNYVHYLTAVGFDPDRTHAVVFIDRVCGNVCGTGDFYFLRKEPSGWQRVVVGGCGWIY
ncbi:MAG TPA: hypothetical protein VFO34_15310 [Candidatus Acidoferrales bacterium]|nr:hypothetical protein [Candidatus Acidoferrales bacterium]